MKRSTIENLVCLLASTIVLESGIIFKSTIVNIIISITGIYYVYYIGKKEIKAYIFGITNVLLLGLVLLKQEVYFNAIYNLFYGLPVLIYGAYYWNKKIDKAKNNKLNKRNKILLFGGLSVFSIILLILMIINNNKLLYLDIFTTVTGILGMLLLANKYIEQWPVWIVSNLVNTIMWIVLSVNNTNNITVAIMWSIYLLNSIYGYYNWENNK